MRRTFSAWDSTSLHRHVDQRGQPGGINVTPSVTFASSNRDPFTVAGGGFLAAGGRQLNRCDHAGRLINNLYGLPARISQVFISNLNQNVSAFQVRRQITLYAEKQTWINTISIFRTSGRCAEPDFELWRALGTQSAG